MNKSKPTLIIINGPSASGKTAIGEWISKKFSIPMISKDAIKELMFDDLGWSDRAWSQKLGGASFDLMWYVAKQLLTAGKSVIVETKFHPVEAGKKVEDLSQYCDFQVLEILCHAEGEVLLERFTKRAKSNRHPGHCDLTNIDELRASLLAGKIEPIKISGKLFEIDTTDFSKIDYAWLDDKIKEMIC